MAVEADKTDPFAGKHREVGSWITRIGPTRPKAVHVENRPQHLVRAGPSMQPFGASISK